MDLTGISRSLPEAFRFYSFGEVSPSPGGAGRELDSAEIAPLISGKIGVSFRLLGNLAALLVVIFDQGLDVSMYSELGNILASKLCQKLSERGEGDLMITPPLVLGAAQLSRLSRAGIPCVHRTYHHVDGATTVPLETLILPIFATEGGAGNA